MGLPAPPAGGGERRARRGRAGRPRSWPPPHVVAGAGDQPPADVLPAARGVPRRRAARGRRRLLVRVEGGGELLRPRRRRPGGPRAAWTYLDADAGVHRDPRRRRGDARPRGPLHGGRRDRARRRRAGSTAAGSPTAWWVRSRASRAPSAGSRPGPVDAIPGPLGWLGRAAYEWRYIASGRRQSPSRNARPTTREHQMSQRGFGSGFGGGLRRAGAARGLGSAVGRRPGGPAGGTGHGGHGGPPPWLAGLFGMAPGRAARPQGPPRRRAQRHPRRARQRAAAPRASRSTATRSSSRSPSAAAAPGGPSPGSVYPTIQQLQDEGLVEVDDERGRRSLRLTAEGEAYVAEHADELAAVWAPFETRRRERPRRAPASSPRSARS